MGYYLLGSFFVGLMTGVVIIRYGISLGIKLSYRLRNDALLDDTSVPVNQEISGD